MEAKKKATFALLLALVVALCFFTGQTLARHTAVDIQGELETPAEAKNCSKCTCTFASFDVKCHCMDMGTSCHEGCKLCSCWLGKNRCICFDAVAYDQCKNMADFRRLGPKAFVQEAMLA